MKLYCTSFAELYKHIVKNNEKIVLFGAGAVGRITSPEILKNYGILDYVLCYLDNNESIWGEKISICGRHFEIRSPQSLSEYPTDTVILINISRFFDVIEQLEMMECTRFMKCFIMPMMLISNFCSTTSKGKPLMADKPLIPKKLHYMWLGRKPLPDNLQKCIDSWKKYCPDYEIIEWNEDNYDISKHFYMKHAYANKAYGFVPDYARLDILYHEGGLYLDTDVELKHSIDDLLYQEAFCGVEKWQIINFGGLSGAVKGHSMVKKFLDARKNIEFIDSGGKQNRNTCGFYDTRIAIEAGYKINGKTQNVEGMNIYAFDYFHPYDYMSGLLNETENTYSVHWFNGGWLDEKMKNENERTKKKYLELYEQAMRNGNNL